MFFTYFFTAARAFLCLPPRCRRCCSPRATFSLAQRRSFNTAMERVPCACARLCSFAGTPLGTDCCGLCLVLPDCYSLNCFVCFQLHEIGIFNCKCTAREERKVVDCRTGLAREKNQSTHDFGHAIQVRQHGGHAISKLDPNEPTHQKMWMDALWSVIGGLYPIPVF